jgi:hypothetical protein
MSQSQCNTVFSIVQLLKFSLKESVQQQRFKLHCDLNANVSYIIIYYVFMRCPQMWVARENPISVKSHQIKI